MPENVPTATPLRKLNSLIAAFFCSSGISRSLLMPANPAMPMPTRQTTTPSRMICPEAVANLSPIVPSKIGGISVPKAEQ